MKEHCFREEASFVGGLPKMSSDFVQGAEHYGQIEG